MHPSWKAHFKPQACSEPHRHMTPTPPPARTRAAHGLPAAWLLVATLGITGCSALQEDKVDYKSAKRVATLEVPPDLTQLKADTRYVQPGQVVTASGYQAPSAVPASATTAAQAVGDVRIERAGGQRWLVVKRPADRLWEPLRGFWQENGFVLAMEQQKLGLLETDWAENRAKLPQDFLRNTLGKVFENLYSTGERDKFRTRIERVSDTETEIFISHRGMQEVYTSSAKDQTVWQPRAADPELEAEFLRRLMLKLGLSAEQAQAQFTASAPPPKARLEGTGIDQRVVLDENFDRAWRRVGLTLDRTGFTVEDRDRTRGLYFVRYVAPAAEKTETGFFAGLFKSTKVESKPVQYRVQLTSQESVSTLRVQDSEGKPDASATAQQILKLLADDLQ